MLVDITDDEADKALKSGVLSIFWALKSRVLSILSQPEKKSKERVFRWVIQIYTETCQVLLMFWSEFDQDFYEDSFEVYYISVSQKLAILGFSSKIFLTLTSVTSETSWGQTMSLNNLTDVSNFSWNRKLSYKILFVELRWKLKHPKTTISQRAWFI